MQWTATSSGDVRIFPKQKSSHTNKAQRVGQNKNKWPLNDWKVTSAHTVLLRTIEEVGKKSPLAPNILFFTAGRKCDLSRFLPSIGFTPSAAAWNILRFSLSTPYKKYRSHFLPAVMWNPAIEHASWLLIMISYQFNMQMKRPILKLAGLLVQMNNHQTFYRIVSA